MKRKHLLVIAALSLFALCAPLTIGGCTDAGQFAWQPVAPGADPLLVNAERADQSAFATISEFLTLEDEFRDLTASKMVGIHKFAESLRERDTTGKSRLERQFD